MPRYGQRWHWSNAELLKAVQYLRAHFGSGPIRMADIERAALAVSARAGSARVLRDRLVASGCLVSSTARGRAADYMLTDDAEGCLSLGSGNNASAIAAILLPMLACWT